MARNMAIDHEAPVAFFSLEMSAVQLMMRLIVAETGLSGTDIKSGRLTPEQWRHLESATKPLGTAPLYIDDTPALSVFEFRSKARRLKIHHDIKIIVIDYLQLMTGKSGFEGQPRAGGGLHLAYAQGHSQGAGYPDHSVVAVEPFDRDARRLEAPAAVGPARVGCHRAGC